MRVLVAGCAAFALMAGACAMTGPQAQTTSAAAPLAPSKLTAEDSRTAERLVETIDGYVQNRGFNGVVLVANAGGVIVHQARGVSSLELGAQLGPDDVFRIGSLTKPLTAVLVLSLVGEGRLRLEGTLGEYLPELYAGTPASGVTIEQLLAHTPGLKDTPGNYYDPFWATAGRQTFTPEAFAKQWIVPEISSPPGKWRYNNNGFYLLGLIVERVTGTPYAEALQQKVFTPAGMTHSGFMMSLRSFRIWQAATRVRISG